MSRFATARIALSLVLGAVLAVLPIATEPPARPGFAVWSAPSALADDDDGGGDDDDDGGVGPGAGAAVDGGGSATGSGGGGAWRQPQAPGLAPLRRVFGVERPAPARRARPIPSLPVAEPAEIVALGLGEELLAALAAEGWTLLERAPVVALGLEMVRLAPPAGLGLEAARAAVAARAPEATVDLNHLYRQGVATETTTRPAACEDPACAAPSLVAWPVAAGEMPACLGDLRIGLVDSGVNASHGHLDAARIERLALDPDRVASDAVHGTAVAALLVGEPDSRTPGLLPGATLVAVDIFQGETGGDPRAGAFALVRALDLLAGRDVAVVNLSLAGPANSLVERMILRLDEAGVALVAAAGNAGPQAAPAYPAAYPPVVGVTAVDAGARVYRRAGRGPHVDLAAPGVQVWTAASISGARARTGTSFATPFVTAAVAALLASGAAEDAGAARALLAARARDLGAPGRDDVYGDGLLQVGEVCPEGIAARAASP